MLNALNEYVLCQLYLNKIRGKKGNKFCQQRYELVSGSLLSPAFR